MVSDMKHLFLFTFAFLSCVSMAGQIAKSSIPPSWVDGYFKEMPNSYLEVVSSAGYDLKTARETAVQEAISRRSLASGTQANVSISQGEVQVMSGHVVIVKARIVDEYILHNSNGYKVWLLVQTAKNPSFEYEPVKVSDEYGFSAKALVPGMAQFEKGSTLKGALFIGSEILFVGGAVTASLLADLNYKKGQSNKNSYARKQYTDLANTLSVIEYICIGGAVAVYTWNVIDGITARGKKHVATGKAALAAIPCVTLGSVGPGLSLAYYF